MRERLHHTYAHIHTRTQRGNYCITRKYVTYSHTYTYTHTPARYIPRNVAARKLSQFLTLKIPSTTDTIFGSKNMYIHTRTVTQTSKNKQSNPIFLPSFLPCFLSLLSSIIRRIKTMQIEKSYLLRSRFSRPQ